MSGLPSGNSTVPLSFGIALFAPVSAVRGSAVIQVTQPMFTGDVIAAPLLIALAEVFLLLANRIFHLESVSVIDVNLGQTIDMPIGELRSLLDDLSHSNDLSPYLDGKVSPEGGVDPNRGFLTVETPSAPLVVGVTIYADYTEIPYSPTTQFIVPLFEMPGLTGALPMLIVSLLITIYVRAVVPPESAGAKPFPKELLKGLKDKTFNLTPDALVNLISRMGKYFGGK